MNQNLYNNRPTHPLVSIIIPTHNSSSYIETTIASIINSVTNHPIEIILVDDASNDIEKLKQKAAQNASIVIIEKKEKSNAADSRNIGLKESKGEYVFFLDSDDSYTETHIDRRVELHKNSDYGLIFGSYIERSEGIDTKKIIPTYTSENMRDYIFNTEGDVRSSTISIYKQNYKGTTFDADQYKHQDWGFAIRAYDQEENIFFDNNCDVIIDNTQNTARMSNRMNVPASEYFLSRYITNPDHILRFARGHLKLSIISKDNKGQRFIRGILLPLLGKAPFRKKTQITLICLATLPLFREGARLFFSLKKPY